MLNNLTYGCCCCWDDVDDEIEHKEGNSNDDKVGEYESTERVADEENIRWTDDWADDHTSPS